MSAEYYVIDRQKLIAESEVLCKDEFFKVLYDRSNVNNKKVDLEG